MCGWEEEERRKWLKPSQIPSRKILGWNELSLFQWCHLNKAMTVKNTWRTFNMHLLFYSKVLPHLISLLRYDAIFHFFLFVMYFILSSLSFASALCFVKHSTNTETHSSLGYASFKLWWLNQWIQRLENTVSNTQINTIYQKAAHMHVVSQKSLSHKFIKTIWSTQWA